MNKRNEDETTVEQKRLPDTANYTGQREARRGRHADTSQGRVRGGAHSAKNQRKSGRHS